MPDPDALHALCPRGHGGGPGGAGRLAATPPRASGRPSTSPGLDEKTRLGPPGVDIEAFSPLPAGPTARQERWSGPAIPVRRRRPAAAVGRDLGRGRGGCDSYAAAEGPRVIFVGKLIVSKGCDLLLAAWPLVVAASTPPHAC